MPIIVVCPGCNSKLKAPENLIGKLVKCPSCGQAVPVKAAAAPAPAPKMPARPAPPPPEPIAEMEPVEDETEAPARTGGYDDLGDETAAPGGETTEKERSTAMWIHLLPILLGWCCGIGYLIPVVMWTSKRKESRFIDHHGKAWLNWFINLFVAGILLGIVVGALQGVSALIGNNVVSIIVGALTGLIMLGFSVLVLIMQVMVALKAKKGEWANYKVLFRLLK